MDYDKIVEKLRVLFAKGDEDEFNEYLKKLSEDYEVDIEELLLSL